MIINGWTAAFLPVAFFAVAFFAAFLRGVDFFSISETLRSMSSISFLVTSPEFSRTRCAVFPTTFEKEVFSDLTGERGVLMGCLAGVMEAQYNVLRKNGHSPSEAFNETVEELTQSLIRLVAENGMDWMYANCSTTAQRGALDWKGPFRDAVAPVFDKLYESVRSGEETRIVLSVNNAPDYRQKLNAELEVMNQTGMWQVGAAVRSLRPENRKR